MLLLLLKDILLFIISIIYPSLRVPKRKKYFNYIEIMDRRSFYKFRYFRNMSYISDWLFFYITMILIFNP